MRKSCPTTALTFPLRDLRGSPVIGNSDTSQAVPFTLRIKWFGREGRPHCRKSPKEGQVGEKRSIPECIRIQKCPIACISYTTVNLDEQKSALYTLRLMCASQRASVCESEGKTGGLTTLFGLVIGTKRIKRRRNLR